MTYEVVTGGTKRGKDLLVDSHGYIYNQRKAKYEYRLDWECTVRSKHTRCYANVKQFGQTFTRGKKEHCHPPVKGALTKAKISSAAKRVGAKEVFTSAGNIIQDLLTEFRGEPFLPKPQNLVRLTNLFRQKMHFKEPTDLSFELNIEYISEEFFREDIHINGHRHLVFSTPDQLRLLEKSKRWYVDATFKVVKAPFMQLFSVHSFIRHGESNKQVPLAYVLMSGKRKEDYAAVLEAIKGVTSVAVVEVVMDFEVAMWQAVRAVFEEGQIKGCVFHWVQAIWRQVQLLGLNPTTKMRAHTPSFAC